ncbi:2-phosphosulfolactate phosphatase [Intrasporangium flavum]|uniref:2-phosphosulfolactate phosphatase n=1 Tax=Intrasporangium flavum TaxID=1428657 RepID=UPI00096FA627|nr:2-phosphosulfolactate phosphatase [Intrasporangium flavum]
MDAWHSQDRHLVRLEWGADASVALARHARDAGSDVVAVVADVLSFTTCVSVGVDRGVRVRPYRWKDASAAAFARENGAVLAQPRGPVPPAGTADAADGDDGRVSLSPRSIRTAEGLTDLVLPSPNGSTVCAGLAEAGAEVVAACLRNRTAVARHLAARFTASPNRPPVVLLVPAGERWPDDSLRPAAEDLWGVGAVADAFARLLEHRAGPLLLSPEARVAVAAWDAVAAPVDALAADLHACSSGRELEEKGYADDVVVAAELDASDVVPVLRDGVFVAV